MIMGKLKVAFAGDWHGDTAWGMKVIQNLPNWGATTLIHLGDFGIWPGERGARYLDALDRTAQQAGVRVLIVPGNHEDYDQIDALTPNTDGMLPIRESLLLLPRGYHFTLGDFSFLAVGGAASIDRNVRRVGESWWLGEFITEADVAAAKASVDRYGRPDFMITHEVPDGINLGYRNAGRPAWFTPEVEYDTRTARRLLREVLDYATPSWLLHGHHHRVYAATIEGVDRDDRDYETRVLGLSNERTPGNLAIVRVDRSADNVMLVGFPNGGVKKEITTEFTRPLPLQLEG